MTDTTQSADRRFTLREHQRAYTDDHTNEHLPRIEARVQELAALGAEYYGNVPGLSRKRLRALDWNNPATTALTAHDPSIHAWLRTVPSAAALHPLYDPDHDYLPDRTPVGDEMREWVRNLADARGIRSRAAVLSELLLDEATNNGERPSRWLSLACGAAQPIIRTMDQVRQNGLPTPSVTLADLDREALTLAQTYATERNLTAQTSTVQVNVLDRRGFAAIPNRLRLRTASHWLDSFDAVDAVGLLEYLKTEDWNYTYRGVISTRRRLAGAVTFLRNAFACVKPGGLLAVGNMLDTHPQLGFTLDVVQWPHIQPRSTDQMLSIISRAGIEGHVDVYLPHDGVYAVYAIRKTAA